MLQACLRASGCIDRLCSAWASASSKSDQQTSTVFSSHPSVAASLSFNSALNTNPSKANPPSGSGCILLMIVLKTSSLGACLTLGRLAESNDSYALPDVKTV